MHTIKMQYPSESSNPNYDGKVHTIVPINIKSVQIGKKDYYLLSYFDNSLLKSLVSILKKEGNTFIKIPLMDYDVLAREIRTKNIKPQRESLSLLDKIENITCSNITNYEDLKEEKRTETMDEIVDIIKSNGNAITIKADGTVVATGYGKTFLTIEQAFKLSSTYGIRLFDNRVKTSPAPNHGEPPKNTPYVPPITEAPILKMRAKAVYPEYPNDTKKREYERGTNIESTRYIPLPYDRLIGGKKFISYHSLAHYVRNKGLQKVFTFNEYDRSMHSSPIDMKADMNLNLILNKAVINHNLTAGCFLEDLEVPYPYEISGAYENYYTEVASMPQGITQVESILEGNTPADCKNHTGETINIYRIKQSARQNTETYGFNPEENEYHVNRIDVKHIDENTTFATVYTGFMKLFILDTNGFIKIQGAYFDPGKEVINFIEGATCYEVPMSLNVLRYPNSLKEGASTLSSHELGIQLDHTSVEDVLYELLGIDIRQEKR